MIALLEPERAPGFVSGGYRYQDEIASRLAARGTGRRLAIGPERLEAVVADLRARGERVVVDGLFAELLRAPLPGGITALLHMVPRQSPWSGVPLPVIATAATTADRVRDRARAVHVVRPGLDDCFAPPATAPCNARLRIVCVGTICRAKGQHLVVTALARHDCDIVLLGARDAADALPAAGRANLVAPGPVPPSAVARELQQADLFVSASRDESYGMAVREATACGVPVLAFATGEIAHWVASGSNGWLVAAAAPDHEFVHMLRDLVDTPRRLTAARHAATAVPRRSWDHAADEFEAAVRS
ncbi:MAG: glycosyltransferase family 4 protein [Planctomycetota bacterium]